MNRIINSLKHKNHCLPNPKNLHLIRAYQSSGIKYKFDKDSTSSIRDSKLEPKLIQSIGEKSSHWNIYEYSPYKNVCVVEMNSNKVNCFTNDWLTTFQETMAFIEDSLDGKSIILKSKYPSIFSSGMDLKLVKKLQSLQHAVIREILSQSEPSSGIEREAMFYANEKVIYEYLIQNQDAFRKLTSTSVVSSHRDGSIFELCNDVMHPLDEALMHAVRIPYSLNYEYIGEAIDYISQFNESFLQFLTMSSPTFSYVTGKAIAGGFALSLAADGLVAVDIDKMGLHARSLGFTFPSAIQYVLNNRFSHPKDSLDIMLMGNMYDDDNSLPAINTYLDEIKSFEGLLEYADKLSQNPVATEIKTFQVNDLQKFIDLHHPRIQLQFLHSFLLGLGPID